MAIKQRTEKTGLFATVTRSASLDNPEDWDALIAEMASPGGNMAEAWLSWVEAKAKERLGELSYPTEFKPATLEELKAHPERYLCTYGFDDEINRCIDQTEGAIKQHEKKKLKDELVRLRTARDCKTVIVRLICLREAMGCGDIVGVIYNTARIQAAAMRADLREAEPLAISGKESKESHKNRANYQDAVDFKKLARSVWQDNSTMERTKVINHSRLAAYKRKYPVTTLKGWLREIDPRPKEKRAGRPKKTA